MKDAAVEPVKVETRKDDDSEAERRRKEAERELEVMLMVHPSFVCGLVSLFANYMLYLQKITCIEISDEQSSFAMTYDSVTILIE